MAMKMRKVGIRLEVETWRKLKAQSKRTGVPQSEIVRRILRKYLK